MGLQDGTVYPKQTTFFETDHILTLTTEDIVCYFNLKVFETTDPDKDSTPKLGRSLSLLFYKKKQFHTLCQTSYSGGMYNQVVGTQPRVC